MRSRRSSSIATILLLFAIGQAYAQASKSPFTSQGIGDIIEPGLAHNLGMGGIGVSNGSYWFLNNVNPALLPYNSLTVFSAGIIGENRTLENNVASEVNGGANLNYLAMAFPIKPGKWTSSVVLMPYSNVDYESSTLVDVQFAPGGEQALKTARGSGGLNQFYWANGIVINRNLSVGLKAIYLFSNFENDVSFDLQDNRSFTSGQNTRISVSDFILSGGLAYKKDSIFNNRIQFKAGFTYDLGANVDAQKFSRTEQRAVDQPVIRDSLEDVRGSIEIPQAFTAGFSFNNGLKWAAGVDVRYQQWSNFRDFEGTNDNMGDQVRIGVGGEFTPDPTSVTSYFKRVTYRIGFTYENTPFQVTGADGSLNQVNDIGINIGWTLPVSRISNLDFALKYGVRGDVDETFIQEEYFKVYLGVTFNDQWFIKRKYN